MDPNFWHSRWENDQIGFHTKQANPLLVDFFAKLSIDKGSRVFVPLCGKTLDMHWLLNQGYHVIGAELSKKAIDQLFDELGIKPKISTIDKLDHYSAEGIDIYVGDIFHLKGDMIGKIDAIYDRAALVALPLEMRKSYTNHLMKITNKAQQLLICFEYDQALMDGPPFSISEDEVKMHYEKYYSLQQLTKKTVEGGFRSGLPTTENVWLLN